MAIASTSAALLRPNLSKHLTTLSFQYTRTSLLRFSATLQSQTRNMSSTAHRRKEWMIHIPDHVGALEKRLSVRSDHLCNIKPMIEDRTLVMGGATLSEKGEMTGSVIVVQAETEQEALEILRKDVYTESGVWNLDEAKVWSFKSAFRTPVD